MSRRKPPLTLPEYDRVFRVIYSVIEEHANTPRACMFFSFVGASILEQKLKIKAWPVAGAYVLFLDSESCDALTFGAFENDTLISHREAFHCWIQTEEFAIDFMAPIFNESMKSKGYTRSVPRKMFQRPLEDAVELLDELGKPGDFALSPNRELTKELLQTFLSSAASTDLANRFSLGLRNTQSRLGLSA